MEIKDWVFLALGLINLIVLVVVAPAVRSLVVAISTLTTRVTLLEDRSKDDRDGDNKTAAEIHSVRNELVRVQVGMAKMEGATESMGKMFSEQISSLTKVVALNLKEGK